MRITVTFIRKLPFNNTKIATTNNFLRSIANFRRNIIDKGHQCLTNELEINYTLYYLYSLSIYI